MPIFTSPMMRYKILEFQADKLSNRRLENKILTLRPRRSRPCRSAPRDRSLSLVRGSYLLPHLLIESVKRQGLPPSDGHQSFPHRHKGLSLVQRLQHPLVTFGVLYDDLSLTLNCKNERITAFLYLPYVLAGVPLEGGE